jgi:hypothetical protein
MSITAFELIKVRVSSHQLLLCSVNVVEYLLEAGADVTAADSANNTALHLACEHVSISNCFHVLNFEWTFTNCGAFSIYSICSQCISINVLSFFVMQGHENAALLLLDKLGKEHINLGNAEGKT